MIFHAAVSGSYPLYRTCHTVLVAVTITMILAPLSPMPHVVEKLIMLWEGTLKRPIDIFDLFFHLAPATLLSLKLIRDRRKGGKNTRNVKPH